MLHTIKKVEYISGYKLKLYFKNGKIKIFDMEDRLRTAKNMFLPLKNIEFFKQVKCEDGAIVWPNGVDICPDVLYQKGIEVTSVKPIDKKTKRRPGSLKGKIKIAKDFDAPLPEEVQSDFEQNSENLFRD